MPLQNTKEVFIKETDILDTGSFEHETFCDQLSKAFQEPSLEVLAVLQVQIMTFCSLSKSFQKTFSDLSPIVLPLSGASFSRVLLQLGAL